MSIRRTLLAATFTFVSLSAAHAEGGRPIEARSLSISASCPVSPITPSSAMASASSLPLRRVRPGHPCALWLS